MIGKVMLACLLCVVLAACAMGRPRRHGGAGCGESGPLPSSRALEGLLRRSAAIASSLRNLRSVRERRWARSFPVWKSLHKVQERAMDISGLPPLPVPDAPEVARDFDKTHALVEKDLNADPFPSDLEGIIEENGGFLDKPFIFPELTNHKEATGGEPEKSAVPEGWGAVDDDHWGEYLDDCSDDIVGNPCTRNGDCQGCSAFHCSTSTNTCQFGTDPRFGGFFPL